MASVYLLPADRSEAARAVISNQGWSDNAARNCWPAIPVAPITAAFFLVIAFLSDARALVFTIVTDKTPLDQDDGRGWVSRQHRCRRGPLERILWPAAARPAERAPPAD